MWEAGWSNLWWQSKDQRQLQEQPVLPEFSSTSPDVDLPENRWVLVILKKILAQKTILVGWVTPRKILRGVDCRNSKGAVPVLESYGKKELLVMGFSEDLPDLSYQKKISFGTPDTPRGTNTRSQIRVLFCFLCYFSLCSLLLQLWWSQRQLSKSSRGRT